MLKNVLPPPAIYKLDATCATLADRMQARRNAATAAVRAVGGYRLPPEQQARLMAEIRCAGSAAPPNTEAADA